MFNINGERILGVLIGSARMCAGSLAGWERFHSKCRVKRSIVVCC